MGCGGSTVAEPHHLIQDQHHAQNHIHVSPVKLFAGSDEGNGKVMTTYVGHNYDAIGL